jgi:hypothetical protein
MEGGPEMTGGTSASASGGPEDPVEEYLDRLLVTVPGSPRQVRHTLAEVEAHLRDAVAEGIAAGLPEEEAEAAAVQRIGPVHAVTGVAAAFTRPTAALARRVVLAAALVGGIALVAVGISGLVAWLLVAVRGDQFLTAPWGPGTYTAGDCARWMAGDPGHNCVAAMLNDHVGDILLLRMAAGVLGVLALAGYAVLRGRWRDRATMTALPAGSAEAVGAFLALLAALGTIAAAVDLEMTQRGAGAGQPFSLAAGALLATVFFAVRLRRVVARPGG